MARNKRRHGGTNVPDYRAHPSPRAGRGEDLHPGEEVGPPSSAAESLVLEHEELIPEGPLVASKDEHERAIG